MTGIDWNAAAKQMGITDASHLKGTNATGTVLQSGAQISTPSFQGGLQLAPQPAYDSYQPSSGGSGGVVAGTIGLVTLAGTLYATRKGHLFKSGKFGGKFGDWVRNFKWSNLKFWGKKAAKKAGKSRHKVPQKERELMELIKEAEKTGDTKSRTAFIDELAKLRANSPLAKAQTTLQKLEHSVEHSKKRIQVLNIVLNGKESNTVIKRNDYRALIDKYKIPKDTEQIRAEIAKEQKRIAGMLKGMEKQREIIKANQ